MNVTFERNTLKTRFFLHIRLLSKNIFLLSCLELIMQKLASPKTRSLSISVSPGISQILRAIGDFFNSELSVTVLDTPIVAIFPRNGNKRYL